MDYRTATREERAAEFIDFATKLHDGRYDYAHVPLGYVNGDTKVTIICPDHGPFEQTPREHRRVRETPWGPQRGQGCRDCRGFNAQAEIRRERFVAKALATHGDRYDYTDVVYLDARTDVTVNCKRTRSILSPPGQPHLQIRDRLPQLRPHISPLGTAVKEEVRGRPVAEPPGRDDHRTEADPAQREDPLAAPSTAAPLLVRLNVSAPGTS